MQARLSRRMMSTLEAAARILVPPGGAITDGADEVGLAAVVADDVHSFPRHIRRRTRLLLTAMEWLPLLSGWRRPLSKLSAGDQKVFLERTYRHRSLLRRMIVSYIKQLCYAAFLQLPQVEDAVGYTYRCAKPRAGVQPSAQERVHH